MGNIIDGKQLSLRLKGEMAEEVKTLAAKYGRVPSLAVILVGENPASQSYVRGKIKAAEEVGIKSELITMPADTTEEVLLAEIDRLNADALTDGVLVQLPLPKHIDQELINRVIDPKRDVDGFHPMSKFKPATAKEKKDVYEILLSILPTQSNKFEELLN